MVPEGDLESDDEDIDREGGAPLGIVTKKSKKKNKQQNITDSSTIKRGNVPGHDKHIKTTVTTVPENSLDMK